MRNAIVFLSLALFLAACAAPATPTPSSPSAAISAPSEAPSATLQPTASPIPSPSLTPTSQPTMALPTIEPTDTAIALPSFTPFVFILPTLTPTGPASSELSCDVVSHSYADGTAFDPNERFTVNWVARNTGTATWYPGTVVFTYVGGSKLQQYSPVNLTAAVAPGQLASLSTDMRAPKNSTTYTTLWALRRGTQAFCVMKMTIWVNDLTTATP